MTDLLIKNAALVATVDDDRRELAGGWVAITDGLISGVGGSTDPMPEAARVIDADGCLVTPGLVNTHHHLFQNLTRAYPPMTSAPLFGWLQSLYPLWTAAIDEEPFDSSVSDTTRNVYGKSSWSGSTGVMARSAKVPWPTSRRPGPRSGRASPTEKGGKL